MFKLFIFFIFAIAFVFGTIGYYAQEDLHQVAYCKLDELRGEAAKYLGEERGNRAVDLMQKYLVPSYSKIKSRTKYDKENEVYNETQGDAQINEVQQVKEPVVEEQTHASLTLKNGFSIEGEIVTDTDSVIVVLVEGQRTLFEKKEIETIKYMTISEYNELLERMAGKI